MNLEEFKKKHKSDIPPRPFIELKKGLEKEAMEFLKKKSQICNIPQEECVMITSLEKALNDMSKSHKIIVNDKEYHFKSYRNIDEHTVELNLEEIKN